MPPGQQATFDAPTDYAHEFEDLASEAAGDDFVGEEEGGKDDDAETDDDGGTDTDDAASVTSYASTRASRANSVLLTSRRARRFAICSRFSRFGGSTS